MVTNHYRWDFIGLSTDTKPTPATSEKVVDGSTYYCSDNSKLYVFYKDTWYEKTVSGGGGGSSDFDELTNRPKYNGVAMTGETNIPQAPTVVQSLGESTTSVMSQNGVTSAFFGDPSTRRKIKIGANANVSNSIMYGVAIGNNSNVTEENGIAIGQKAVASYRGSISIGSDSYATRIGEVSVNTSKTVNGYNYTNYRIIGGVHDGELDHDVATVGQIKMGVLETSPTGTTAGMPGRLYTLDTGGGVYEVYLCVHDNGDNTYVWKQLSLI